MPRKPRQRQTGQEPTLTSELSSGVRALMGQPNAPSTEPANPSEIATLADALNALLGHKKPSRPEEPAIEYVSLREPTRRELSELALMMPWLEPQQAVAQAFQYWRNANAALVREKVEASGDDPLSDIMVVARASIPVRAWQGSRDADYILGLRREIDLALNPSWRVRVGRVRRGTLVLDTRRLPLPPGFPEQPATFRDFLKFVVGGRTEDGYRKMRRFFSARYALRGITIDSIKEEDRSKGGFFRMTYDWTVMAHDFLEWWKVERSRTAKATAKKRWANKQT